MAREGSRPGGRAPPRTEEELPRLPAKKVAKKLEKPAKPAKAAKPAKKAKLSEDAMETNIVVGDDGPTAEDDGPVFEPSAELFEELAPGDMNVRCPTRMLFLEHRKQPPGGSMKIYSSCAAMIVNASKVLVCG